MNMRRVAFIEVIILIALLILVIGVGRILMMKYTVIEMVKTVKEAEKIMFEEPENMPANCYGQKFTCSNCKRRIWAFISKGTSIEDYITSDQNQCSHCGVSLKLEDRFKASATLSINGEEMELDDAGNSREVATDSGQSP